MTSLKILGILAVIAAAVVAVGVALVFATRLPPILASGQPDPFTVGTAILLVGYFLFPVLALLAAALLLVAMLLVGAHGQVVFPASGSWYTSPYDGGFEVR